MARAPSPSGASKRPASRVKPPTVTGSDSTRVPPSTPRYRGSTTVALHPSRASAGGSEPRTSASPPVFANGCASEPMIRTDRAIVGRRALGVAGDLSTAGRPAARTREANYATCTDPDIRLGTSRSGMGGAANRRTNGLAIHRAQCAERLMRALSVAIPVFAYIWRYSFETSTNATRALIDSTQLERFQMFCQL